MIDILYKKMNIPESCSLNKKVFKKLFFENADLTNTDKKAFRDDIDSVLWKYTLKPSTIQIKAYKDKKQEYLEVAILQINLKDPKRYKRIAEVVHRAIPHPLLLIFSYDKSCTLSLASKRFSQADKENIVPEDFFITDWLNLTEITDIQKDFLNSLEISKLPHKHFLAFYQALIDRFIALDCARFSHKFSLNSNKQESRKNRLADCHRLELEIADIKSKIKKEAQFNRKVELNSKVDKLKNQLNSKIKAL